MIFPQLKRLVLQSIKIFQSAFKGFHYGRTVVLSKTGLYHRVMFRCVLLSNDDGIGAEGLQMLASAVRPFAQEVVVVAPREEQSSRSHAITLGRPLEVEEHRPHWYSVNGTPVDAVLVGMFGLLPRWPDLVISGINHGHNLGEDVFYSGTVAAAREAAIYGIPAIAISQGPQENKTFPFETAKYVITLILKHHTNFPPFRLLNVNVPGVPLRDLRGVRVVSLGTRVYASPVTDLGNHRFQIGGSPQWHPTEGTDLWAVEQGFATLTPLTLDLTDHEALSAFRSLEVRF